MWKHSIYRAMEKISDKFYQETLNKVHFWLIFAGITLQPVNVLLIYDVDYEQSLFFSVVRRAKRKTRKWPRAWLMVRDPRDGRDNSFSSRAAALVSCVSRLRRSRALALPLLNRKKKKDCSQSIYDEKTETHTSYLSLLKLELDNKLQEFLDQEKH